MRLRNRFALGITLTTGLILFAAVHAGRTDRVAVTPGTAASTLPGAAPKTSSLFVNSVFSHEFVPVSNSGALVVIGDSDYGSSIQ